MTAKSRVLLLSASSGAGHVRAAQALEKAFSARGDCLIDDPARLKQMQDAARRMDRLNAGAEIAQDALALVN